MSSFRVVHDACVLFPPRLRDTLLRAAEAELYGFWWTDEILEELRRNLVGQGHASAEQAQRIVEAIAESFEDTRVTGHEGLTASMPNDPKDRHVAAAAVAAHAQVIVTSNLRDFPPEGLAPLGIEVQSPDVFLTHLFHLAPGVMVEIVEYQAAVLNKPPMEAERILDKLAIFAPEFVRLVRDWRARRR